EEAALADEQLHLHAERHERDQEDDAEEAQEQIPDGGARDAGTAQRVRIVRPVVSERHADAIASVVCAMPTRPPASTRMRPAVAPTRRSMSASASRATAPGS